MMNLISFALTAGDVVDKMKKIAQVSVAVAGVAYAVEELSESIREHQEKKKAKKYSY